MCVEQMFTLTETSTNEKAPVTAQGYSGRGIRLGCFGGPAVLFVDLPSASNLI